MEEVINAAIDMLNLQGHKVQRQGTSKFDIDGYQFTRQDLLELVNGTYSVEELQEQLRAERNPLTGGR
jgi:hypothetical protein